MKIALCFSGQPRSIERTFPLIDQYILQPYSPDVFAHLWWSHDLVGKKFVAAGGAVASDELTESVPCDFINRYKPKVCLFEEPRDFDEKNYNDNKAQFIKPKYSLSQRYSIMESIGLCYQFSRPRGIVYDLIIRMRTDWAIQSPIEIEKLPLKKITMPNDGSNGGYNDQFAIGNPANMRVYADLFKCIDIIYNDMHVKFVDELLLQRFLDWRGVDVNLIPITYNLMRAPGPYQEVAGVEYV